MIRTIISILNFSKGDNPLISFIFLLIISSTFFLSVLLSIAGIYELVQSIGIDVLPFKEFLGVTTATMLFVESFVSFIGYALSSLRNIFK